MGKGAAEPGFTAQYAAQVNRSAGGALSLDRYSGDPVRGVFLKSALLGLAVLSAIVNVLYLTGSFFMLEIYDRVLPRRSVPTLIGLCIGAALLYAFQGFLDVVRGRVFARLGLWLDESLGSRIFVSVAAQPLRTATSEGRRFRLDTRVTSGRPSRASAIRAIRRPDQVPIPQQCSRFVCGTERQQRAAIFRIEVVRPAQTARPTSFAHCETDSPLHPRIGSPPAIAALISSRQQVGPKPPFLFEKRLTIGEPTRSQVPEPGHPNPHHLRS
jgi:hypothetical protein